jgi:hypothetical protein
LFIKEVKMKYKKTKKVLKQVGRGAKEVGTRIATGATGLVKKGYESIKEYNSPEAQEKRLALQERKLKIQARQAKIRSMQAKQAGSSFGGFGGIDMGNVFGSGGGGGLDVSGNFNNAFGMIGGSSAPAPRVRRFRTVRTIKRYKVGRSRGKTKYRTRTIKRRVAVRSAPQPKAFDPFSQF